MEKTFSVSVPAETRTLHPKKDGRAEVTYTVTNNKPHPARGRIQVTTKDGASDAWFKVHGEPERDFGAGESQQCKVLVAIPTDARSATFGFRLDAVNVANPQEDFTEGDSVSIDWKAAPPAEKKPLPKWLLPTIGAVILLVIVGVILAFVLRGGDTVTVTKSDAFARYPVWDYSHPEGAFGDVAFWRPRAPQGFSIVGDYVTQAAARPSSESQVLLVSSDEASGRVVKPARFNKVWSSKDAGTRPPHVTVWRPVPPTDKPDYVALGDIVWEDTQAPDLNAVRCVHKDLVVQGTLSDRLVWGSPQEQPAVVYHIKPVDQDSAFNSGSFYMLRPGETKDSAEVWCLKKSAANVVPAPTVQETPALDLTYITDDFPAAAVIHVNRILESQFVKRMPVNELEFFESKIEAMPIERIVNVAGTNVAGSHFDLRKVEQIILLMSDPREARFPAVIVRFADGDSWANARNSLKQKLTEHVDDGRTYYRYDRPPPAGDAPTEVADTTADAATDLGPVACFFPNEKTLVSAPESVLKKMIRAQRPRGSLVTILRGIGPTHDAIFVARVEPSVETLKEFDLPEEFATYRELLIKTSHVAGIADVTGDPLLELLIETDDAETGAKLHEYAVALVDIVRGLHVLLQDAYASTLAKKLSSESATKIVQLTKQTLFGINATRQGSMVRFTLKQPALWNELPELLTAVVEHQKAKAEP